MNGTIDDVIEKICLDLGCLVEVLKIKTKQTLH